MSTIYPPDYVNVPSWVVYDKTVSPTLKDTYCQLRGLAWKSGYKATPPYQIKELVELLGKTQSTLYEHMHALKRIGWLLFSPFQSVAYIFSFPTPTNVSSFSENQESPLLNTELNNQSINSVKGIKETASEKSENDDRKRDPTLDYDAVMIYRRLTHITANPVQRDNMVLYVKDFPLWEKSIKHWLGHGWSKMNVTGMIESYKKRGEEGCSMCQRQTNNNNHAPAAVSAQTLADMARKKLEERKNGKH